MTNIAWVEKFNSILNRRRLSYAWIAGVALWIAWLLSIFTGSNGFDRAGQVIGTDYIQFYTAGHTVLRGESDRLYDFAYQSSLEQEIIGPGLANFHAFITPPLLAAFYSPFALLPYALSFAVWSLLGFLLLWLSVKLISHQNHKDIFIWSLLWFPVFASISFGQNSLLSLGILSFAYASWKNEKYILSGLIASLLFYKPQLIIGLIVLWILDIKAYRGAIAGFVLASLLIVAANVAIFPEASMAYWNFVRNELPHMISQDQFPIWHMHTIRGFWMMLLVEHEVFADILYVISIVVITIGFIKFFKQYHQNKILMFAAAICFSMLITPHAMIYDWSLLLIPAVILWNYFGVYKQLITAIFAIMWIGAFISGPLSFLQLNYFHIAVQISIPIFIYSSFILYKTFIHQSIIENKIIKYQIDQIQEL
jgi:alpha-1,2-mannosyltransferase